MQAFQRAVFTLSRWAANVSALILVLMVGHIVYEIVLRTFFASSTFVLDEFVGYGVAATSFLALGYALETGALIRVNLLLNRLDPRSLARRAVELFCCVMTLAAMSVPIWFFGRSMWRHYEGGYTSGTIADVPAWLPESFVFAGMALFWLQLLAYTLRVAAGRADLDATRAANLGGGAE